ncbi:MAG: hypothetical protein ACE5GC_00520 [Acidimicrobiia bacterium]
MAQPARATNRRLPPRVAVVAALLAGMLIPVAAFAAGGRFTDDDTSIFETDIEWTAASGITIGCNPPANDRYCPDEPVTRGQMAAFMHRLADNQAANAYSVFHDAPLQITGGL